MGRLLESQGVGVAVYSYPRLCYAWANDEVCRLYRDWTGEAVTGEQLVGRAIADPGTREAVWRAGRSGLRQYLERAQYTSAEVRERYTRTTFVPMVDAQGGISYVAGIAVDVTDLVRSRREVARLCEELEARHEVSFRQFAKVLDDSEIGMVLLTYPELRYLVVNAQACRHYSWLTGEGAVPTDFLGKTFDERSAEPLGDLAREAGRTGQLRICEPVYLEGQTRYAKTILSPLQAEEGRTTHVLGLSVDVSQLVNARKESERLAAAKDEFMSVVSHELRTPITVILAGLQLLTGREGGLDHAAANRQLRSVATEALILKRLSGDLLDASRLDQGGLLTIHKGRGALAELVSQVADTFARGCLTHRVEVTRVAPCEVEVDRDRIEQVLVNLLSNAVKYSEPGTAVRVSLTRSGRYARVEVADEGAGIPPEDLPHLFERHFRGPSARRHAFGLGLGLYLSNIIVQEHGGRLSVKSAVGRGSTFALTLPLRE
jgi:signal transduction histidine kinase